MYRPVALACVAVAATVSTAHAHSAAPGPEGGADATGAVLLVLLSLAVVAGRGLVGAGPRLGAVGHRLAALAAAAVVAVALTVAAPHLVHHALDADQGASCPVLQVVDGTDATTSTSTPSLVAAATEAARPGPIGLVVASARALAPVRAPPA